ncbi:hypothetical protein OROHE_018528 [Orobanche hederae]
MPSKIKIFMWRLLRNSLPMRPNLLRRGIKTDLVCVTCSQESETTEHIFFLCPYARLIWALSGLPIGFISPNSTVGIWNWFKQVKEKLESCQFETFIFLCWSIWNHRNKVLHGFKVEDPALEVQSLLRYVDDTRKAGGSLQIRDIHRNVSWNPPLQDSIKINFDASFISSTGVASAGIVARNATGQILWWRIRKLRHGGSAENAEAFAAWHAIILAHEKGWKSIFIEGDSLSVIQGLSGTNHILSTAGHYIDVARRFKIFFDKLDFFHINREGNSLAHRIASWKDYDSEGCSLPF